jgi:predicted Zn-dependent protease
MARGGERLLAADRSRSELTGVMAHERKHVAASQGTRQKLDGMKQHNPGAMERFLYSSHPVQATGSQR